MKPDEIVREFNNWADESITDLCGELRRNLQPDVLAYWKGEIRSIKSCKTELKRIIKEGK